MTAKTTAPTFSELFTPKLVTVLREGYGLADLKADAVAGITVAIVALPLSMAIAIASGVTPDRGLYTAIVGGFLVSALGGSRYWLSDQNMEHTRGAPSHPQTQGKIERWHQTLKNRILLENYFLPGDLDRQIAAFVEHYNHRRYHESLDNLRDAA